MILNHIALADLRRDARLSRLCIHGALLLDKSCLFLPLLCSLVQSLVNLVQERWLAS